jgi:hypothetical protein
MSAMLMLPPTHALQAVTTPASAPTLTAPTHATAVPDTNLMEQLALTLMNVVQLLLSLLTAVKVLVLMPTVTLAVPAMKATLSPELIH